MVWSESPLSAVLLFVYDNSPSVIVLTDGNYSADGWQL